MTDTLDLLWKNSEHDARNGERAEVVHSPLLDWFEERGGWRGERDKCPKCGKAGWVYSGKGMYLGTVIGCDECHGDPTGVDLTPGLHWLLAERRVPVVSGPYWYWASVTRWERFNGDKPPRSYVLPDVVIELIPVHHDEPTYSPKGRWMNGGRWMRGFPAAIEAAALALVTATVECETCEGRGSVTFLKLPEDPRPYGTEMNCPAKCTNGRVPFLQEAKR